MSGVSRALPAKVTASPTEPGAWPPCQLGVVLQLLSAPPPFQILAEGLIVTVNAGVVVDKGVGALLSVIVAVSDLVPGPVAGAAAAGGGGGGPPAGANGKL